MTEGLNTQNITHEQQHIYFNPQQPTAPSNHDDNHDTPIYFNPQTNIKNDHTTQNNQTTQINQHQHQTNIEIKQDIDDNINNPTQDESPLLPQNKDSLVVAGNNNQPKDGDGCCKKPHLLSYIFTALFWVFLILQILIVFDAINEIDGIFITIALIISFLAQFIESCCSSTMKYLSNIYLKEELAKYINELHDKLPKLQWKISCYHYERVRKRVTTTDNNGHKHTKWETRREKRYTHHAINYYQYNTCKDISMPLFDKLEEYKLTQVTLIKRFEFGNIATQNHYNLMKNAFVLQNNRDVHYHFYETIELDDWKDKLLAESSPGVKPGWINVGVFLLCSFIGFSPCYRNVLGSKCGSKKHEIVKQIFC